MSVRDDAAITSITAGPLRCLGTWAGLTALAGAVAAVCLQAWPDTAQVLARLDGAPSPPLPEQLIVAAAQLAILVGVGWLWVLSTLLVLQVARGLPARVPAPRWLRAVVLLGCGAVIATAPLPAQASRPEPSAGGASPLSAVSGLPLPELPLTATSPAAPRPAAPPQPGTVRVRAGDTLWRIARRSLPSDASTAEISRAADGIWRANRAVIGDDPNLIQPGQELRR